MPKGFSLHVGLNEVDPKEYKDQKPLKGCVPDANSMHELALKAGFEVEAKLLNENATKAAFILHLDNAISKMSSEDILFITFSGHGGKIKSKTYEGQYNEVLCFYDGLIADVKLCNKWRDVPGGARVLVISDSCYSGGVLRDYELAQQLKENPNPPSNHRGMDSLPPERSPDPKWSTCKNGKEVFCTARLLAACSENQLAKDSRFKDQNSMFTATLLEIWNDGQFGGNYGQFMHKIQTSMRTMGRARRSQPLHQIVGVKNEFYDNQQPFTI